MGTLPQVFDDPQMNEDPIAGSVELKKTDVSDSMAAYAAKAQAAARIQDLKKSEPSKAYVGSDSRGVLGGDDMDSQWRVACAVASSGMVPKQFEGKPGAVLVAMQSAKERGLNPWNALQQTANINGRSSNWGELPLGEVMRAGILKHFEEYWLDEKGNRIDPVLGLGKKRWAAVCEAERMDGLGGKIVRVFSHQDAETARLLGKDTWKQYGARMLQMRARGWALKDAAPEVVAGIQMPEYDDFEPEPKSDRQGSMVSKLKDAVDGPKEPEPFEAT